MTVDTQSLRAYDPARPAPWRGCSSANTTSRGAVTEAMSDQSSTIDSTSPVRVIPSDASQPGPQPGGGLCLSGGGYRDRLEELPDGLRERWRWEDRGRARASW